MITKITAEWLISHHACKSSVDDFRHAWPKGAALTKKNIERAELLRFPSDWCTWLAARLRIAMPNHSNSKSDCPRCRFSWADLAVILEEWE